MYSPIRILKWKRHDNCTHRWSMIDPISPNYLSSSAGHGLPLQWKFAFRTAPDWRTFLSQSWNSFILMVCVSFFRSRTPRWRHWWWVGSSGTVGTDSSVTGTCQLPVSVSSRHEPQSRSSHLGKPYCQQDARIWSPRNVLLEQLPYSCHYR